MKPDYDVLIIGSGFGGSITALRLTEKGYRVGVLEAGQRFSDEDFAKDIVESAQVPVGAETGLLRNSAHPSASRRVDPGRGRRRRRFAELRQYAVRAAGPVLQRPAVVAHHRLALGADAALPAGTADARRRHQPDLHRRRPRAQRGGRRYGLRRHVRADAGRSVLRARRRQDSRRDRARSVLRWCGPGTDRLRGVWLLHDGLPLRRQEHTW